MKKPGFHILALITCIFAAFLGGFALGRNLNRTPVQITRLQAPAPDAVTEPASETDPVPTGPVNINTTTAAELEALPGIGPVLARRILDDREANGDFRSPEELTRVKGIGEATVEEIWDLITVGG